MVERVLVLNNKFANVDIEEEVLSDTGVAVESMRTGDVDEAVEAARDVDVLMSQGLRYDREAVESMGHLAAIGVYGTGTDGIDVAAATDERIRVLNVPDYGVDEVSTHAMALALACLRRVVPFDAQVKRGEWDWRGAGPLARTSELTFGLVGYGNIARGVAAKARPFFAEVLTHDPYVDDFDGFVRPVGFDALLESSDVVSIHAPLTEETDGLFGPDEFAAMPDGAVLVNVARGGIVDIDALHAALSSGEIGTAGLDVFPAEPPGSHPLFDLDNVVCSPHVAWYSEASERELRKSLARDVRRLVGGERPENVVNEWDDGD